MTQGNSRIDREAIAQDTFITAVQKVEHLMHHPRPIMWVMTTARNKVMDEMKRKTNIMEIPTTYEDLDKHESAEIFGDDTFPNLEDILTKDEMTLLKKHWDEGYTLSEIADMESVKPGTLRLRMSRIYAKIKKSKIICILCDFFII